MRFQKLFFIAALVNFSLHSFASQPQTDLLFAHKNLTKEAQTNACAQVEGHYFCREGNRTTTIDFFQGVLFEVPVLIAEFPEGRVHLPINGKIDFPNGLIRGRCTAEDRLRSVTVVDGESRFVVVVRQRRNGKLTMRIVNKSQVPESTSVLNCLKR